jgi:peptide/nickel transport system substrate-binding protein
MPHFRMPHPQLKSPTNSAPPNFQPGACPLRSRPLAFAGTLIMLLTLAGCGEKTGSSRRAGHPLPANPMVAKSEPGRPGERFTIALTVGPKTFNPLFAFDGASDAIVRLLYRPLVELDLVNQQPGPGLAESWSVEPDQKTWTFKLRRGVRWSDGHPLTADDVVFTWNQVMYNRQLNQLTFDLFHVGGKPFVISSLDEATVRVVTPEVFAPLLEFFGGVAILPKHVLEPAIGEKRFPAAYSVHTRPDKIIGCGPYCVQEFRGGKQVVLRRNPEYWVVDKQGTRLPYFDEVAFVFGGGAGTDALLFLNGNSDAFETVRPEAYDRFKQASAAGRFQLLQLGVGMERDFLWFNQNTNAAAKPLVNPVKLRWFRDKKFRQAVSCAIDRERMAREVYGGRAQPIYGFISTENQKWNNPNVARYALDVQRARSLLAEIGIQDRNGDGMMEDAEGNQLEILFHSNSGNPTREKAATMIVEDLKRIGIKLIYLPIDFPSMVQKVNATFDYECALMGLGGGGVDPASQMNVLRSTEELHQWFPFQKTPSSEWEARIDALMDAQMRTLDVAQRKKAFDEVQVILAEELPMIYTVSPFSYAAIRVDVGNLRPSVLTPYHTTWNLEELYFKK